MFHDEETTGSIHVPYNWEYADQAAREGATGLLAADVGKLARQLDDNTLWMLTATTPTWQQVGSTGSASFVTAPTTTSDAGVAGQIAYDTDYFYVCVATNTWARVPLSSW